MAVYRQQASLDAVGAKDHARASCEAREMNADALSFRYLPRLENMDIGSQG